MGIAPTTSRSYSHTLCPCATTGLQIYVLVHITVYSYIIARLLVHRPVDLFLRSGVVAKLGFEIHHSTHKSYRIKKNEERSVLTLQYCIFFLFIASHCFPHSAGEYTIQHCRHYVRFDFANEALSV